MKRTKHEITTTFGKGPIQATITIPAGTRCKPCGDSTGQFFVDDLSWLDKRTQGLTYHDAYYYGIRLNADQVAMTEEDALKIVGRRPHSELRKMALALSLHSWNNSTDEWRRLEAAVVMLGRRAPEAAKAVLANRIAGRAS